MIWLYEIHKPSVKQFFFKMRVGHFPGLFCLSGPFTPSETQFSPLNYTDLFTADLKGHFVSPAPQHLFPSATTLSWKNYSITKGVVFGLLSPIK
jgi:hypothetical protein